MISRSSKISPKIILVPLLAFDKKKNRLGYGKGFYDKYLSKYLKLHKKIVTIGVAFSFQKYNNLPVNYKDFKLDEWFFKVHWKNDPNVPGMLQIESLVQMAALAILSLPGNKGKVVYLTSANNLKFFKKIVPGSRLYIETKITTFKRGMAFCEGIGLMDKKIVCKADFNLILPDEIKNYH